MRKGDDGEEKEDGKKIMMKIVATNVVASRPPERRPTATPNARAKSEFSVLFWSKALVSDLRPGPS